ncbi:hypothetical protein Mp_8g13140 [Marchantia polymorpha subsp. ruderalis]|uniref:Uncharacterized protein n=1 Tax=Marchantia polymorpha TaxID=3197 RepID=A0A2R6WJK0_MARPO|nr:hypothetical protein MARPO_0083s0007 [Marchantia polymorpha]BBN19729.1 hypothetical protein Mp_8g13140 [Marchantia polymorpha subsp. ruderalis]|eukprot:PTQ34038.1 hypothetical protein MARPO_0083s0007 [Marchantia polymorpha]
MPVHAAIALTQAAGAARGARRIAVSVAGRHEAGDARSEEDALHELAAFALRRQAGLERVEDGRVVVQGLEEVTDEGRGAAAELLLHEREHLGRQAVHGPEERGDSLFGSVRHVREVHHAVHGQAFALDLLQKRGAQLILVVDSHLMEREGNIECGCELGEALARLLRHGQSALDVRATQSRDAQVRRPARAAREGLHQRRPLNAFENVVVDDVHAALALEGLENGLVRGEVAEFDVGRHLVQHLERTERVVLRLGHAVGPAHALDAELEALAEIGRHSLHGAATARHQVLEPNQYHRGQIDVRARHRLGPGQQQMHQAYPVQVLLRSDAQLRHHARLESARVRRVAILERDFRRQMLVEEIVAAPRCLSCPHPLPLRLPSQLPDPDLEAHARWPRPLGQRFLLLLLLLLGEWGRGIDEMARRNVCTGRAGAGGGIWEIQDVDGAGVGITMRREALAGRGAPCVLGVHGQADVGAMKEHGLHERAQVVVQDEMFLTGDGGGVAAHDHVGRREGTTCSRIVQVLGFETLQR